MIVKGMDILKKESGYEGLPYKKPPNTNIRRKVITIYLLFFRLLFSLNNYIVCHLYQQKLLLY